MTRRLLALALLALATPALAGTPRQPQEWTAHRSDDGANPSPAEQEALYLVNRARQDPTAEGFWLATDPHVEARFGAFPVDWSLLRSEFEALSPQPPVAFDARILDGEDAHARYMLDACTQTHAGQRERVEAAGFDALSHRVVAWTLAESPLWGHAAFQIDFGGPASEGGMQTGRPHRAALMGPATHAGYGSAQGERRSCQPALSLSGSFATSADPAEPSRFLVGTVYEDADENGRFDAGEGIGGVTVSLSRGAWFARTAPAGGYALPLPDVQGDLFVSFTIDGSYPVVRTLAVADESLLLDWIFEP